MILGVCPRQGYKSAAPLRTCLYQGQQGDVNHTYYTSMSRRIGGRVLRTINVVTVLRPKIIMDSLERRNNPNIVGIAFVFFFLVNLHILLCTPVG